MRRSSGAAGTLLALAILACGNGAEEAMPGEAGESAEQVELNDLTASGLPEPECQPSERMDVVGRASPYDSTTIDVGEGMAKICYGRPYLKGRIMIGGEAVPYDTLWRTGANEPTTIHLNVPATIAGLDVEPGSYSLYTIPREGSEWTLIVNRSTSQWGHESTYTEEVRAREVGRTEVQVEPLDSEVEQLTLRPMSSGGVALEWQDSRVRIPITPAG